MRHYVDNRAEVFEQVIDHYELARYCNDPRKAAKSLFIRILNGGSKEAWLREYSIPFTNKEHLDSVNNIGRINDKIVEKFRSHPEYKKAFDLKKKVVAKQKATEVPKCEWKTDASAIAWAVQTEENKILMDMEAFFKEKGWVIGVLMFDGLMVRRQEDSAVVCEDGSKLYRRMEPQLLRQCESYIEENTGYKIKLSEKDMLNKVDIFGTAEAPNPEMTLA